MATLAGESVPLVVVHNKNENNEAYGYLKVIKTEDDMQDITPQHIAVFPNLPDRVPPVAAILTLESQTELSHINVLAINRGTLNVAVSDEATSVVADVLKFAEIYKDKPVKLSVAGQSLKVVEATDAQVVQFQEKLKAQIGTVEIPSIILDGNLEARKAHSADSPATIGAKAANYGRIERLLGDRYVKPGYAIGFDLYRHIITSGDTLSIENSLIAPLLQKIKLGRLAPREINYELAKIRDAIHRAKLPLQTLLSLEYLANNDYSYLKDDEKIRFRSSTNSEDLPRFNGAGLYISEGIKIKHLRHAQTSSVSMEKLHKDLLSVMGSLWLPRAFWEREYFSIDHIKAGMSVQINPSFTDEAANGVIIASKKNNSTNYWVNTQFGEAAVTNPLPGEIPESIKLLTDKTEIDGLVSDLLSGLPVVHSRSNIGPVFLDNSGAVDSEKVNLAAELLKQTQIVLSSLISEPEKFGIDIEFKIMSEDGQPRLYLKQARPLNLSFTH